MSSKLFVKKDKRGGPRLGAGAPKKTETVVKTYRCRPHEVEPIKAAIKREIAKLRKDE